MEFTESLKKNRDFLRVYHKRKSRADARLVLYIRKNDTEKSRLGISVSRKVGNSVVRHRVKRLIKEAYRLHESGFKPGYDLVFVARSASAESTYREIESSVMTLSEKQGIMV